ncbi:MAG: cob(I)yrinic acid a,c-diamide adenosyltransferase [Deltaproteobacteria bacterium]|nr:cob(I)yrinic acid a,c-diamide adenosyltransferase [Deltaproteobacteria bacterium]
MAKQIGLVTVFTGNGKGKTTSALGCALRAVGYGKTVCVIQFMKGTWHYGELDSVKRLAPELEMIQAGKGFYRILDDKYPKEVHEKAAAEGAALALEKVKSGDYAMVVLDEINVVVREGLLPLARVHEIIDARAPEVHVILTGRNAHPSVVQRADLVTEMVEVKHPYQKGVLAQKGLDY